MKNESNGWILITGGAGFLGSGLIEALAPEVRSRCVCLVRKITPALASAVGVVVEGFFGDPATLENLRAFDITAVVHLAAVTGGCSEADGMAVNVEGTRVLLRHFSDRGCRRFVLASSIAAVGLQRPDFRPLTLPMTEEHPCLDRDGYGFSKFLMEEVAAYHHRQNPALTVFCLRFGVIRPDDANDSPYVPDGTQPEWSYAHFSKVRRADAVRAILLALAQPSAGEFTRLNIVAKNAALGVSVRELLTSWNPASTIGLSAYADTANERASVFSTHAAEFRLGFGAVWH